jgi:hypothetical protein
MNDLGSHTTITMIFSVFGNLIDLFPILFTIQQPFFSRPQLHAYFIKKKSRKTGLYDTMRELIAQHMNYKDSD